MKATKRTIVTTSWDDGDILDIRLADVLRKHNITGTFYVPLSNRERPVMNRRHLKILDKDFEIGCHGRYHIPLTFLDQRALQEEVAGSKAELENILGHRVLMFCYPLGRYNRGTVEAVRDSKFIGARTTAEFCINTVKNQYLLPTTIQVFPHTTLERIRHSLRSKCWGGLFRILGKGVNRSWTDLSVSFFDDVVRCGGIWHIWGHSWEIEKYGLWQELNRILEFISRRPGVEYLTNGEVVGRHFSRP